MTIASKDIIVRMLKNDGAYPGDPRPYSIYRYIHRLHGRTMFAVFMRDSDFDPDHSPFDLDTPDVGEYELLWQRDTGFTPAGKNLICSD